MTAVPETIAPHDTTEHAACAVIHGGFRNLPVVDGAAQAGLVQVAVVAVDATAVDWTARSLSVCQLDLDAHGVVVAAVGRPGRAAVDPRLAERRLKPGLSQSWSNRSKRSGAFACWNW